ncbi:hypothetical protein KBD08_00310 [Candidatus Babeliales bacterium]|nr:hypothetical protein [Candidatus Babeliales bacterium]
MFIQYLCIIASCTYHVMQPSMTQKNLTSITPQGKNTLYSKSSTATPEMLFQNSNNTTQTFSNASSSSLTLDSFNQNTSRSNPPTQVDSDTSDDIKKETTFNTPQPIKVMIPKTLTVESLESIIPHNIQQLLINQDNKQFNSFAFKTITQNTLQQIEKTIQTLRNLPISTQKIDTTHMSIEEYKQKLIELLTQLHTKATEIYEKISIGEKSRNEYNTTHSRKIIHTTTQSDDLTTILNNYDSDKKGRQKIRDTKRTINFLDYFNPHNFEYHNNTKEDPTNPYLLKTNEDITFLPSSETENDIYKEDLTRKNLDKQAVDIDRSLFLLQNSAYKKQHSAKIKDLYNELKTVHKLLAQHHAQLAAETNKYVKQIPSDFIPYLTEAEQQEYKKAHDEHKPLEFIEQTKAKLIAEYHTAQAKMHSDAAAAIEIKE